MHNEIINSDVHSTDTHGFSEVVAAISGLVGLDFRPRLASIHKRQLYSINAVHTYKELGYKIVPDYRINHEHIEEHWDEILRFVCTIKLGYEKGSNLFRRLNSYSRLNPLHKALKDLGRIYSTLYILKYIDQPEIPQSVEEVLSKVEHANKFAKAITLGNNQDFNWATQYEQHLAAGCKRLIMNAINYYNLLLLSEKVHACQNQEEKNDLLSLIARSSTHTWQHINLQGEFDFTENEELPKFDMSAILNSAL
jgi:TnpA family transposase